MQRAQSRRVCQAHACQHTGNAGPSRCSRARFFHIKSRIFEEFLGFRTIRSDNRRSRFVPLAPEIVSCDLGYGFSCSQRVAGTQCGMTRTVGNFKLPCVYSSSAPFRLARMRNWFSGKVNSAVPQFMQTDISGKIKIWGLSRLSGPGIWTAISAVNLACFSDPHAIQSTYVSHRGQTAKYT